MAASPWPIDRFLWFEVGLTAFLAAWLRLENAELKLDWELVVLNVIIDGVCEIRLPDGAECESLVIVSTLVRNLISFFSLIAEDRRL